MHKVIQRFSVPYEYPVVFTRNAFDTGNPVLRDVLSMAGNMLPHKVMVFLDSGLVAANPELPLLITRYFAANTDLCRLVCNPETVPGGENAKNGWNTVQGIMTSMGANHMCRHSLVVAVGGGGMLDMTGFAASLVHRGVRLLRIPSTVLAQNDAGIGVKTGMNEHGMKNFAGTFAPPFAVVNDFALLRTLPDEHWLGGISEAFKVAILKDTVFFDFLRENAGALRARSEPLMEHLVTRCAELHLEHIRSNGDPFESGSARPLDFGHWSAHWLERASGFSVGHGQAVSVGIALDSCYATGIGLMPGTARDAILDSLAGVGLPLYHHSISGRDADGRLLVLDGLEQFREHLGGVLSVTLPTGIGSSIEAHRMDHQVITRSVDFLAKREVHL